MKYLTLLLVPIFCFLNCNPEGEDDTCPTCETCVACEEPQEDGYKSYEVDFFTTHPTWEAIQTDFETVTEQYFVKASYREGAVLDTFTEQIAIKSAYRYLEILDSQSVHLVVDAEMNSIGEILCYQFYSDTEIIDTIVPFEYQTLTRIVVSQPGTGEVIYPAEYKTITKEFIKSPAQLNPLDSLNQSFNRITFTIPDTMSIQTYIDDQLAQQGIMDCIEGNAYRIVE